MNIRKTANGDIQKVKNCTPAIKNALISKLRNSNAIIKAGTNITILSVETVGNTIWGKNYSGYVALSDGSTEYCTKQ